MQQASTLDTRIRPFAALKALRALLRNGEDTRQVFLIVEALRGRSGEVAFERFRQTETGQAVLSDRRVLLDRLSDRAALAALPAGSLGRAYLAFMAEENLTADGLVEASKTGNAQPRSDDRRLFGDRNRDSHDLQHVVTGYGRDGLGEVCLLAFGYARHRNRGIGLIALAGMLRAARMLPGRPVKRAVFEAYRHGRRADWMAHQDWEALLSEPLDAVRHRMNVQPPTRYQAILASLKPASEPPALAIAAE
jgi:ubiquinone biosynthesis protein COQ4